MESINREMIEEGKRLIMEHYGIQNQALQLCEECGELIQATSKFVRQGGAPATKEAMIDEIVDVRTVADQFLLQFGVSEEEIQKRIGAKVQRQIRRINEEMQLG